MIHIEELFCRLANGVLQNTSLVEDGELDEDKKSLVMIATNEALVRLHSRFILKEGTVIVEMQEGRTNYPLLKKYAVASYDPASGICPYIMDLTGEPFGEDVIKVLTVFDNFGCERAINDRDDCWSVFTPRPYVIQNPRPRHREALSIQYQQGHPKVTCDDSGDGIIDIPETLDSALDSYIAYRCFAGINTQEAKATAADMLGHYESVCAEVIAQDLLSTSKSSTNKRFKNHGWV